MPEQTLETVLPYLPVFGITRVANVTGLDDIGIPVVMVVRPNSRSLAVSQGKGTSLVSAKVSGIMEAIEGYHAEILDIPTRLLSYRDMKVRHEIVDVSGLALSKLRPFDTTVKLPWVLGHDLATGAETWVPYEIVHTDYTDPPAFDSGYFISDSNGLASGNCRIEAVLHGLCEVIERDALTLWFLLDRDERNRTKLDPATVDSPDCRDLLERFASHRIETGIWDVTSDVGVPAYICKIIQDGDGSGIRPALGAGCHPCRNIALSRALTEAAQSRLTFISGARDDQSRDLYRNFQSDETSRNWREEIRAPGAMDFRVRPEHSRPYLEDDLDWILDRLAAAGLPQAVYVDLTREEFNIPIVKVVVPGLENHTMPERRIMGPRALARTMRGHHNA